MVTCPLFKPCSCSRRGRLDCCFVVTSAATFCAYLWNRLRRMSWSWSESWCYRGLWWKDQNLSGLIPKQPAWDTTGYGQTLRALAAASFIPPINYPSMIPPFFDDSICFDYHRSLFWSIEAHQNIARWYFRCAFRLSHDVRISMCPPVWLGSPDSASVSKKSMFVCPKQFRPKFLLKGYEIMS